MPVTPQYPELLLEVGEILAKGLERVGLTPEAAASKAWELTEHVRQHWGGQDIYIPKGQDFELAQKYLQIHERWRAEGFSRALHQDTKLSTQRLRQIVHLVRSQRRQKVETATLFPESASA